MEEPHSPASNPALHCVLHSRQACPISSNSHRHSAQLLADAFEDDPYFRWLLPGDSSWKRRGPALMAHYCRVAALQGEVQVHDSGKAVALWFHATASDVGRIRLLVDATIELRLLRAGYRRQNVAQRMLTVCCPDGPFTYLGLLGVSPGEQGRGTGGQLLVSGLQRADTDGFETYLETASERSIGFYERFHFRVTDEIRLPSGPRMWCMVRPARGETDPT